MKPIKEQIEAVAEWWAVRTFDKLLNQNNGDNSDTGGFAFALMNMSSLKAKQEAPVDGRDRFKQSLIRQLSEDQSAYLDVDYHPSEPLSIAAEESGISTSMIPIKTFTQWDFQKGVFRGRYQYGGAWETIGGEYIDGPSLPFEY